MKERILQFIQAENKSSSQLAEEIGVQPSGISHIISGRNNPSLDFILKMLLRYTYLSPDWLLFGKGSMYKDQKSQEVFDNELFTTNSKAKDTTSKQGENLQIDTNSSDKEFKNREMPPYISPENTEKVVYFYKNGTFREYFPGK